MPKYVIVSGRSSHTVTAPNKIEAEKQFKKSFPYAEPRHTIELTEHNRSSPLERVKND